MSDTANLSRDTALLIERVNARVRSVLSSDSPLKAPDVSVVPRTMSDLATDESNHPHHRAMSDVPSAIVTGHRSTSPASAAAAATTYSRRSASVGARATSSYRTTSPGRSASVGAVPSTSTIAPYGSSPRTSAAAAVAARSATAAAVSGGYLHTAGAHSPAPTASGGGGGGSPSVAAALGTTERERLLTGEVSELRTALLKASQALHEASRDRQSAEAAAQEAAVERDAYAARVRSLERELEARDAASRDDARVQRGQLHEAERERDEARATVAAADTALARLAEKRDKHRRALRAANADISREKAEREGVERRLRSLQTELERVTEQADRLEAFIGTTLRAFVGDAGAVVRQHDGGAGAKRDAGLPLALTAGDPGGAAAFPRRSSSTSERTAPPLGAATVSTGTSGGAKSGGVGLLDHSLDEISELNGPHTRSRSPSAVADAAPYEAARARILAAASSTA